MAKADTQKEIHTMLQKCIENNMTYTLKNTGKNQVSLNNIGFQSSESSGRMHTQLWHQTLQRSRRGYMLSISSISCLFFLVVQFLLQKQKINNSMPQENNWKSITKCFSNHTALEKHNEIPLIQQ